MFAVRYIRKWAEPGHEDEGHPFFTDDHITREEFEQQQFISLFPVWRVKQSRLFPTYDKAQEYADSIAQARLPHVVPAALGCPRCQHDGERHSMGPSFGLPECFFYECTHCEHQWDHS